MRARQALLLGGSHSAPGRPAHQDDEPHELGVGAPAPCGYDVPLRGADDDLGGADLLLTQLVVAVSSATVMPYVARRWVKERHGQARMLGGGWGPDSTVSMESGGWGVEAGIALQRNIKYEISDMNAHF